MSSEANLKKGGRPLILWLSILIAPTAWFLQMQLNYLLVQFACYMKSNILLHLVTVLALAIAGYGGWLGWRSWWKQSGSEWPGSQAGAEFRSRFMAMLGLLLTAMFVIVIIAQGIANFLFNPCQK